MRKLLAVAMLVGGLLAGAGPAMADTLEGLADPLTLARFGVLMPYITASGAVAVIAVASPVGHNPGMRMLFYNASCTLEGTVSLPETVNDIAFVDPTTVVPVGTNGLVAIAKELPPFALTSSLEPLTSPIHARVYVFSGIDGSSRVLEPIILAAAEAPPNHLTWSPLRTAASFFAPAESELIHTTLTLVCPRTTIQGAHAAAFPVASGFPNIAPNFNSGKTPIVGRVYDTNEMFLGDISFNCDCLTEISLGTISSIYSAAGASLGTYTELEVQDPNPNTGLTRGTFTGYFHHATVGSLTNNFFGRLSSGSRDSLNGPHAVHTR
jgi:hypothetical protein